MSKVDFSDTEDETSPTFDQRKNNFEALVRENIQIWTPRRFENFASCIKYDERYKGLKSYRRRKFYFKNILNEIYPRVKKEKNIEQLKVVVTGAAGQMSYSLLYLIAKGDVFGATQTLELILLDDTPMMEVLNWVVMELQDCAFSLLKKITATDDPLVAFKDVDAAFMVGAMPRKDGMARKELLKANVKFFKAQGQAMDKVAKKTVKVVVVGNPANTNACILSKYAPSIPKANFTCLTRLDQNRAQAQIAARLGVPTEKVTNVIIWGNHSSTQFPDVAHAKADIKGKVVPVPDAVKDDNYLKNDFIKTVQLRGPSDKLSNAMSTAKAACDHMHDWIAGTKGTVQLRGPSDKLSNAMSTAKAACDHMHDWIAGTKGDNWVSMGVISDGSYSIKEGLVYSYPVQIKDKSWKIVQGLSINQFAREKLDATAAELEEELDRAIAECTD